MVASSQKLDKVTRKRTRFTTPFDERRFWIDQWIFARKNAYFAVGYVSENHPQNETGSFPETLSSLDFLRRNPANRRPAGRRGCGGGVFFRRRIPCNRSLPGEYHCGKNPIIRTSSNRQRLLLRCNTEGVSTEGLGRTGTESADKCLPAGFLRRRQFARIGHRLVQRSSRTPGSIGWHAEVTNLDPGSTALGISVRS